MSVRPGVRSDKCTYGLSVRPFDRVSAGLRSVLDAETLKAPFYRDFPPLRASTDLHHMRRSPVSVFIWSTSSDRTSGIYDVMYVPTCPAQKSNWAMWGRGGQSLLMWGRGGQSLLMWGRGGQSLLMCGRGGQSLLMWGRVRRTWLIVRTVHTPTQIQ